MCLVDGALVWRTTAVQAFDSLAHSLRLSLPFIPLEFQSTDYELAVEYAVPGGSSVFSGDWQQSGAAMPVSAAEHEIVDMALSLATLVQVRVLLLNRDSGEAVASSHYLVVFLRREGETAITH